ncbi:transcription elongation factor GreA [Rickettsiales bacterium]|nr:transcription elongation factor GreA [Rickettsiales bacterium]
MEEFLITSEGFEKLKTELNYLKDVERPKIIEQIAAARDLGDLKENSEYHSAKEKQGIIEAKISDLTNKSSRARIIDKSQLDIKKVTFGVTIELENLDNDNIVTYKVVSEYESNIDLGHISDKSPIARALIGKAINDEVEIKTPGGIKEYKINKIFIS